jgi:hypothetical protein
MASPGFYSSPELDGATIKKLAEDHENIKGFDASKATFYDVSA